MTHSSSLENEKEYNIAFIAISFISNNQSRDIKTLKLTLYKTMVRQEILHGMKAIIVERVQ